MVENTEGVDREISFEKSYFAPYYGEEKEVANLVALRVKAGSDAIKEIFERSLEQMGLRRVWGELTPGHYVYDSHEMRIEQEVSVEKIEKKREGFFKRDNPQKKSYNAKVSTKIIAKQHKK